jgi:hypothetical protein
MSAEFVDAYVVPQAELVPFEAASTHLEDCGVQKGVKALL